MGRGGGWVSNTVDAGIRVCFFFFFFFFFFFSTIGVCVCVGGGGGGVDPAW